VRGGTSVSGKVGGLQIIVSGLESGGVGSKIGRKVKDKL